MEARNEHTLLERVVIEDRVKHHLLVAVFTIRSELARHVSHRRQTIIHIDVPLGGAPHNAVPGLVLVVLHILEEVLGSADSELLHILVKCQIVLLGNVSHHLLNVAVVIAEGVALLNTG
jgi:hypothetical protein